MKIEDEPGQATIGRIYEVPLVRLNGLGYYPTFRDGDLVPIIGPLHEDLAIIGVAEHWHIDWRFVSPRLYARTQRRSPYRNAAAFRASRIIMKERATGIVRQLRKCYREPITFPTGYVHPLGIWKEIDFIPKLEAHYANASAACGKCPHRGFPLQGQPFVEGTRVRVCPGHGLAWDEEGRLVPRREIPQAHGYE